MVSPAKFRRAVGNCLDRFHAGQSPLRHLESFLGQLRADPDWSEQEIAQVDATVRGILLRLAGSDEEAAVRQ